MNNSMLNFTPAFAGIHSSHVLAVPLQYGVPLYDLCRKSATLVGHFKDFVCSAYDSYLARDAEMTAFRLYQIAAKHRDAYAGVCPDYDAVFTTDMIAKLTHIHFLGQMLGSAAYDRLSELVKVEHDWDDDGAKAMAVSSLSLFHTFALKSAITPSDLGIFLGFEGEILINWHMKDGKLIDIAFRDGMVEIYTDDSEEVYSASDDQLYDFIEQVK